ncbi:MAG: two-component system, NtrC family, response regulator HydG, partial [Candidatus Sumerlaeota bacterium]|nr:two-component system, NtrC family, response regulator HydG [Candidatus Sumerlaeota bacterium]
RAAKPLAKVSVTWKLPSDLAGRFRQCDGGTLIVNLQRDFPADMQYTLLEMANDKAFADPHSGGLVEADVRIVITTGLDMEAMRKEGSLLPELSDLLRRQHIDIPPIRKRPEDIPALVRYAVKRARDTGRSQATGADAQVLALFRHWRWPGNTEDLLIVTAEAALNCQSELISLDDVPQEFLRQIPEEMLQQAREVRLPRVTTELRLPEPSAVAPPPPPATQQQPRRPAAAPTPPPVHVRVSQTEAPLPPPTGPAGPATEEIEAQARRLQRLFTLARRLNMQSQILADQMAGPVDNSPRTDRTELAIPESPWDISDALESELDRGLDSILSLRRQLAVLNDREKKAIETARDVYKRLLLSSQGEDPAIRDQELIDDTQELAGDLQQIDSIIQRVSGRFPKIDLNEGDEDAGSALAEEEARAIAQAIQRAGSRPAIRSPSGPEPTAPDEPTLVSRRQDPALAEPRPAVNPALDETRKLPALQLPPDSNPDETALSHSSDDTIAASLHFLDGEDDEETRL